MLNKKEQIQIEYIEKIKNYLTENNLVNLTCKIITFGCQMNAKDSEKLEGMLNKAGFKSIDDENKADIVIFNTCTVRENANMKLYGHLGQIKNSYLKNKNKIIGICGCMMQEKDEVSYIKDKFPFVKLIFGTHNIYELPQLLYDILMTNKKIVSIKESEDSFVEHLPTTNKYKFKCGINIMYGCNNFCTYCIVPYVRGRERSRNCDDIINEIKEYVNNGIIEVMLLGQNVNSYGNDLRIKNIDSIYFYDLLEKVCEIDGLKRIRFMTSHPKDFTDELIEVIKNNEKICRHIHLPIQSGSNKILKLMNRNYTREHYLNLVDKIRKNIKDVSITTDIIVGFPYETEEDFNDTIDIVEKVKFDSIFSFVYSKRTGTKAATYEYDISEDIIKDRFNRLLDISKIGVKEHCDKMVDNIYDVLVEDKDTKEDYLTGRLSNNFLVHFKGSSDLIGKICNVKLVKSHGFYFDGLLV